MARAKIQTNTHGPAIRGVDPWAPSAGKMRQLLSEEERARLAVDKISSTGVDIAPVGIVNCPGRH